MPMCSTLRKAINAWQNFLKLDISSNFLFNVSRGSSIIQKNQQHCMCGFVLLFSFKMSIPHALSLQFQLETSGK